MADDLKFAVAIAPAAWRYSPQSVAPHLWLSKPEIGTAKYGACVGLQSKFQYWCCISPFKKMMKSSA
jgi:hypothetical protein